MNYTVFPPIISPSFNKAKFNKLENRLTIEADKEWSGRFYAAPL